MIARLPNNTGLLLVVFFYIYGPVLLSVSIFFDVSFFVSICLIIYSLINRRTILPNYVTYFTPLIVLFLYCMFLVSLTDEYTMSIMLRLLLKPYRVIVIIMGGGALAKIFYYRSIKTFNHDILYYIFISITIHGIIMVFQILNPDFKDWVYGFTTSGQFRSKFDYNFRMGGLTQSSGGAVLSVVQSLGVLLTPFIWKDAKIIKKFVLIVGCIIIVSSVLICGRSGFWAIIIGLPTILLWQSGISFYKTIIKYPLFVSLFGGTFYLILFYYGALHEESKFYHSFGRTLDVFLEYFQGGKFSNPTVNELKSHIIFPTDIKTIMMGDGEHLLGKQFDRVLNSDIGYIKNIWAFGIIGSIIFWLPLLLLATSILRNQYSIPISKPLLMFIILMFVFHLKENFLYVRMFFSMISLMAGVYYIDFTNRINCIRLNNLLKHNY